MSPTRGSVLIAHPSAELYGSDRVMLETVSALTEDHRVLVVLPQDGPLLAECRARGARAEIVPVPVLRKSLLSPRGLLRLTVEAPVALVRAMRTILRNGIDTVYVSTVTVPVWLLAARLAGRRTVTHVHEAEGSAGALTKRALSTPLLLAHSIAANSRFSADVLAEPYPGLRERTRVILNAVDAPPAPTDPRAELDGPVRLIYVGRLSERKGVDVAVEAVALLTRRGVPATLEVVGDVFPGYEWFREQLLRQVEEDGIADRVHFAGFRPSVWDELAAADIAIVPSRADEPFGNTAVEAVLSRRPLIVSDTSGLREAAAGYASAQFVQPGNATAIADAVERMTADWPALREGAIDASKEAAERHSRGVYDAAVTVLIDAI